MLLYAMIFPPYCRCLRYKAFSFLPYAAVVDQSIFVVHGGPVSNRTDVNHFLSLHDISEIQKGREPERG